MKKINVILCVADQLRAFETGCYGNKVVQTPNIDHMAQKGVQFETAVTNNPVCTPARSSLITGQYSRVCTGMVGNVHDERPSKKRIRLPDSTIAELFRAQGYATALIGKWHVDPDPTLVGFDSAVYPPLESKYYEQTYFDDPNHDGFPVKEFGPEFEGKRLEEFLHVHRAQPFFLYYNISQPHMPLGPGNMPEKYCSMYPPEKVPVRPNAIIDGKTSYNPEWFKIYTIWDYWWRVHWLKELPKTSDYISDKINLQQLTAWYYGSVSCVDDQVGRMLHALKENGILGNTLVVFTSDHGDNLGSHGFFNKSQLFEESIRIPLIFFSPTLLQPQINSSHITQLIDVMPTVLDFCELEIPSSVQGRSLMPLLCGKDGKLAENAAFIETDSCQIGIRTPAHLYGMEIDRKTHAIIDDSLCFFNLVEDPCEMRNLIGINRERDIAEKFRVRLRQWHEDTSWLSVDEHRYK